MICSCSTQSQILQQSCDMQPLYLKLLSRDACPSFGSIYFVTFRDLSLSGLSPCKGSVGSCVRTCVCAYHRYVSTCNLWMTGGWLPCFFFSLCASRVFPLLSFYVVYCTPFSPTCYRECDLLVIMMLLMMLSVA